MQESRIHHFPGGVAFHGDDAITYFRVAQIKSGLQLWHKAKIRMNRHITVSSLLKEAGKITNKNYPASAIVTAIADLDVWLNAMRTALPETYE